MSLKPDRSKLKIYQACGITTMHAHYPSGNLYFDCSAKQEDSKFSATNVTPPKQQQQDSQGKGIAGLKDDGGKLMWNLLPWKAVNGMIKVLTFGAKKYSPNGWRNVPNAKERYQSALLRHLYAMNAGEHLDPDSGLRHIDHILTNAAFLAELED